MLTFMTKKKPTKTAANAKATKAKTSSTADDTKKPAVETKAAPKAEPKKEDAKTEDKAFPLYTLLFASTAIVATFIATKDLGKAPTTTHSEIAKKVEKPALHVLSDAVSYTHLTLPTKA